MPRRRQLQPQQHGAGDGNDRDHADAPAPAPVVGDRLADVGGILADPGGEYDADDAVHGAAQADHAFGHAPGEILQRQLGRWRIAGQQLAHVVADAGQAFHAAVVIQQVLDLVVVHAARTRPNPSARR
ncbi:hypothetical protein G6F24_016260 [Rhizopus arrhizus]|nr:hypothetical protein G6F24_016260 [Rhizopus arrhizus]